MKMYFTSSDTQPCILNNEIIIQQVVIEWNRKINKISTEMIEEGYYIYMYVDNSSDLFVTVDYIYNRKNRLR